MMARWKVCALTAPALILIASATLMAADDQAIPAERQAKFLERYPDADADGNGVLTREEARQYFASKHGKDATARKGPATRPAGEPGFGGPGMRPRRPDPKMLLERHPELDTDKDGKLSRDELMAARDLLPPPPEGGFGRGPGRPDPKMLLERHPELDTDGDGSLSEAELKAAREKFGKPGPGHERPMRSPEEILKKFPEADKNSDGSLSEEELEAFRDTMRERGREEMGKRMLERFPDADTDGDGQLSPEEMKVLHEKQKDEMRAKLLKRAPEADTNGDGQLSDEEMKAFARDRRGFAPPPAGGPDAAPRGKRGPRGDRGFRGGEGPDDGAAPKGEKRQRKPRPE